jgi:hypothetical protein
MVNSFVVNLYFLCSSPGVGVVIELVYSFVALEQVFHCDNLLNSNLNKLRLDLSWGRKFH